jgi:putative ABC transport system substrate-binding protein
MAVHLVPRQPSDGVQRRQALLGIAGFAVLQAAPLRLLAQPGAKIPVIGLLDAGMRLSWWKAFRQQMGELGYLDGKGILYEARYAQGNLDRLPALAEELVRRKVAVIVTAAVAATQAAKRATDRIPIVTATGPDHVSQGFAASLARPGGNITGLTTLSSDLTEKRLQLLRELFPKLSRLAVLWQSDNPGSAAAFRDLERATQALKITLQNVGVRKFEELAGAFSAAAKERTEALFVIGGPMTIDEREQIEALARKHKFPTVHSTSLSMEAGGLIFYGVHSEDLFRRAAVYVDKILKGAKPGDLPIEQPTKFELIVNTKTAKSLGIKIPQSILLRADRVIE